MRCFMGAVALVLLAGPVSAETVLRLSETARVSVRPDELSASMRAEAQSPEATKAQNAVNVAMGKALATARAVSGLSGNTGGYQVYQVQQPNPHWLAAQTLDFAGADGDAVLGLVGHLQEQGLMVQGLNWRLAEATAAKAREQATEKALGALRARAEAAAKILGLKFDSFREVRLDGVAAPRPVPRMVNAAMAIAAPVAEAGDVDVAATVEADAILK